MKRYAYLPGVLLLIAALVRAALQVTWDRTGVTLGLAGAVVIIASLVWNRREVQEWLADPRGVFAVASGVSTVLLVAILVLLNILAWYRPFRVDLTASERNTVTAETRVILGRLARDVALRQFGRGRDPQVDQLLSSFAAASRRIRMEFVDADRAPREARSLGVIKNGTVVVTSGRVYRKVENPTEQAIVTAILQATSEVERTVCFVTGHGERGVADESAMGLSRLASTLEAANYRVDRVSLLEREIPAACSLVVIAGPQREPPEAETARLSAYATAGGRMLILLDPPPAASMTVWLTPWGITAANGIIVDTSGAGQTVGGGPQTPLALAYPDHPITRGFEIATMFDLARPLEVATRPEMADKPVAIAQTGNRSFEETEPQGDPRFDEGRDRRGPLTVAAAGALDLRRPPPGPAASPQALEFRLVVVGDSDFVTNAFLMRQGNRDFILRIVPWLAGEAEATLVSVGERENRRIDLTERARVWMYVVNLGMLPLIPLLAGIIVLVRSRG